jgi:hypothetical protein
VLEAALPECWPELRSRTSQRGLDPHQDLVGRPEAGLSETLAGALGEVREGGPLFRARPREVRRAGSSAKLGRPHLVRRGDQPLHALPLLTRQPVHGPERHSRTAHSLDAGCSLGLTELGEPGDERIPCLRECAQRRRRQFCQDILDGGASSGSCTTCYRLLLLADVVLAALDPAWPTACTASPLTATFDFETTNDQVAACRKPHAQLDHEGFSQACDFAGHRLTRRDDLR